MKIVLKGEKIDQIPVVMNYRIIELFSAGLYSSPNKAFEELVSNAYDANANKVSVYVPTSINNDSVMWVCDNGTSMDVDGLKILWKIGESTKRDKTESLERKPIGKFGIGKLATYVLAKKLTHICKKNGKYLAVTMDYGLTNPENGNTNKEIILDEIEIEEDKVKEILEPIVKADGAYLVNFDLWGEKSEDTWTIAIMSELKPKASKIKEGMLRWVISTALPLSPQFNLFYNGIKLESSKAKGKVLQKWVFGKDDEVVEREDEYESEKIEDKYYVHLPNPKNVRGYMELYEDSLVKGKSQDLGRSYGIFLMIRERLINIDNPLIGSMQALNHAVFNRIRIVIHADDLDEELTSGRESIIDSESFSNLQKYIEQKFNKAKAFFDKYVEGKEKKLNAALKISHTSSRLSRRPLFVVAKRFFSGEIREPFLIDIPPNLKDEEKTKFLDTLEEDSLKEEGGLIKDISMDSTLTYEDPIAKLDLQSRIVKINMFHPFFVNFAYSFKSTLPFKLIATTEILTEASMIEHNIDQETVRIIMRRRDELLREMTYDESPNAPAVAMMIRNALSDSNSLEDALFYAFDSLGFQTTKIGGNGKPDGKAVAIRGISPTTGEKLDYSLTYDAKSTGKDRIQAGTVKASACVRHRQDYNANYSVVVSVDFADSDNPESAVNKEAKEQKITLIKANDFWKLVLMAIPNQVNFSDLETFLKNCHTVPETNKWINELSDRTVEHKPIKEILDTTWELMHDDKRESPNVSAIRIKNQDLAKYSKKELINIIRGLEQLVPRFISLDEKENIILSSNPDRIMECVNKVVESDIPKEFISLFETAFETKLNS